MSLTNGVECGLVSTVQNVELNLYREVICGHDNSEAVVDVARGDEVTEERRQEVLFLNQSLGTDYGLNSIIMTHCEGADDGICVVTPNAGGATYTLDRFSPVSGRTQYTLVNSCISLFGRYINQSDPMGDDLDACGFKYEGPALPVVKENIAEARDNIDHMRFAFDYPNIFGALVAVAFLLDLWLGTDALSHFQILVASGDTTDQPEAVFGGDTDGATVVEEEPMYEEPAPIARAERQATRYPMEIFRTGGDGNTVGY